MLKKMADEHVSFSYFRGRNHEKNIDNTLFFVSTFYTTLDLSDSRIYMIYISKVVVSEVRKVMKVRKAVKWNSIEEYFPHIFL